MTDRGETISEPIGYVPAVVGAIVGSVLGGLVGIQVGTAVAGESARSVENPLDDIVVNTFDVIGSLLLLAAITIVFLCAGVALGVYIGLRARQHRLAGATALLCIVLDTFAVPGAFVVAIYLNDAAPDASELAGLSVVVIVVPLAARWLATRVPPPAPENPL